MKKFRDFFSKKYVWAIVYAFLLSGMVVAVLLDTFVISHKIRVAAVSMSSEGVTGESTEGQEDGNGQSDETTSSSTSSGTTALTAESSQQVEDSVVSEPVITENSYESQDLSIHITTQREYETQIYMVDVQVSSSTALRTAFAENSYGRNIKETTSQMAEENQAVLVINGDYYGFRNQGFVLRNGVLYRDTANAGTQALTIDSNGDFDIVEEEQTSAQQLLDSGVQQVLSFGPALLQEGEISVSENQEVGQAMQSNPRTAIGQIEENHYLIIVTDGRTTESDGVSLYELAEVFQEAGAETAYNLDGGGSSTLWFNGQVLNQPTSKSGERLVSDIVYFR